MTLSSTNLIAAHAHNTGDGRLEAPTRLIVAQTLNAANRHRSARASPPHEVRNGERTLNRDGLLKTQFKEPLGKVSYHILCHSRVQNVGQKTRELLELIPGTMRIRSLLRIAYGLN